MQFSEILTDIYDAINEPSSPATAVVSRIKRFVNEGQRVILSEPGLRGLVDHVQGVTTGSTIVSVASTARVVVRDVISRVLNISDRTNDLTLRAMSLADYRAHCPDPSAYTGVPSHYVLIGRVALAQLPADASEIFIKSTSASDTNTAYLDAVVGAAAHARRQLSVTMNGVTAVSFSASLTNVVDAEDLYLSASAVGTVTVHEDSGSGTTIASIQIGQLRPRYTGFLLWPTPADAYTYSVDYRREITDLVNDTDEPALPLDYHWLLSAYARMRVYEKTDDTRFQQALAQWQHGLSRLKFHLTDPNDLPVARAGRRIGYSRNGAAYPADSWSYY